MLLIIRRASPLILETADSDNRLSRPLVRHRRRPGSRRRTGSATLRGAEACVGVNTILDVWVRSGAGVTFRAGTVIEFATGFRVYDWGVFTADLTLPAPCVP